MQNVTINSLKMSFEKFIQNNKIRNDLKCASGFIDIFDILNSDEAIIAAIDMIEANKPALAGNIKKIEEYCAANPNNGIDLSQGSTRQAIGTMQKAILEPFGYVPSNSKRITKSAFSSAACYQLKGHAVLKVVKTISFA